MRRPRPIARYSAAMRKPAQIIADAVVSAVVEPSSPLPSGPRPDVRVARCASAIGVKEPLPVNGITVLPAVGRVLVRLVVPPAEGVAAPVGLTVEPADPVPVPAPAGGLVFVALGVDVATALGCGAEQLACARVI